MTTQSIAITGANGHVGRAVLRQLQESDYHVTALTRRALDLPAERTVVGDLDSPQTQAALVSADVVIHLAGTLRPLGKNSYQKANLDTTRAVANAASEGSVRRIIFLSFINADAESSNAYLRSKGQAKQMLRATEAEVVVFRAAYIIGSPDHPGPQAQGMMADSGKAATVLGNGQQRVAPVYVEDVASTLVSAIDRGQPGIYELAGPVRMTMDELTRLVNEGGADIGHIPPLFAQMIGLVVPSLPLPMINVMLQNSAGSPAQVAEVFGINPQPLAPIWT